MDALKIAKLMLDAAETLGREEVMYAMGLDSDHAQTCDYVTATLPDGSTTTVEVPISDEESDRRLAEDIAAHNSAIAALIAAASDLVESDLGVTLECAPGGSGQCDGLLGENVSDCGCACHTSFYLPGTVEGVKAWHDEMHGEVK